MSNVTKTLEERGSRYGSFQGHSQITQSLKLTIKSFLEDNEKYLSYAHIEALDMICHKIGRIVNGDPNYKDSWHDIAGYATLAEEACIEHIESDKEETDPLSR